MNKKGFTLVELLAVIVILALLALLTSTAVTKLVKDAKNDLSETQIQLIKSAADTWIADNINNLPSSGSCGYLTLEDLKYYGLLDNVILDPKNSEEISNDLKIKITTTTSAYGNPVTTAEVNPESIEGCSQIYFPICTIATDSTVKGLNMGAKYNCKVDPNKSSYTFYVLTEVGANDATVNMIMDSNITSTGEAIKDENPTDKGLVAWVTKDDYTSEEIGGTEVEYGSYGNNNKGPITAMEFLQTATSNWTNVNSQIISTFDDDAGETHNIAKTYTVNARLPYYSEISNVSKSTLYLIDYLYADEDAERGIMGRNGVSGVYGYWTLSSIASRSDLVWYVDYTGNANLNDVVFDSSYGVRPVITVPINRITQ